GQLVRVELDGAVTVVPGLVGHARGGSDLAAALVVRAGARGRAADVEGEHPHLRGSLRFDPMAVVTASSLRKEIAGSLLFEGVSFSVERRDRLSLSGPT